MQIAFLSRPLVAFFALSFSLAASSRLSSQQVCACGTPQPFGSCTIKKGAYPSALQFPGAAVVVPRPGGAFLYIADLYGGATCRYLANQFDQFQQALLFPRGEPLPDSQQASQLFCFPSPLGSNATTGIAFRQDGSDRVLIWAIENKIYRTDLSGNNLKEMGTVDLARLATALKEETGDESLTAGSLGGITFHASRGTLWGVDYINDAYFEFNENGTLVPASGKPNFFLNPRRNKLTGGAYGNSITYLVSGGQEYFDVPVGSLTDRRPSEVMRFHAADGAPPNTFKTGDQAGITYPLGSALGSPKFVTGIAFYPDPCQGGSAEFVLDLDTIGGKPEILEVSANEPAAANVADFQCEATATATVTLTWKKTRPYTSLKITRTRLSQANPQPVTVFENSDFNADPEKFVDQNVLDGTYEYAVTVAAAAAPPPATCRITLGVGSLLAHRIFKGKENTANPVPYAITVVNAESGSEKVMAVDIKTGAAEIFDADLNHVDAIDGPPVRGIRVGIAYNSDDKNLYWLDNLNGEHFLHKTGISGATIGTPVRVQVPANLLRGVQLGDITYDPVKKHFWTVDLLNNVIFGITTLGAVADSSKQSQIPNPEKNGLLSGGIELVEAQDPTVTLDLGLGKASAGYPNQIARFDFSRSSPSAPGKETLRLDISSTTGATDFGGIAILEKGDEKFEYVVAMDTRTIYKLRLTSETSGGIAFRRGDINNDGKLNISDPSFLLAFLFKGGASPQCLIAADVNDSKKVEITDAIYLFNYLFRGGAAPPAPFPTCGVSIGSSLTCTASACASA